MGISKEQMNADEIGCGPFSVGDRFYHAADHTWWQKGEDGRLKAAGAPEGYFYQNAADNGARDAAFTELIDAAKSLRDKAGRLKVTLADWDRLDAALDTVCGGAR